MIDIGWSKADLDYKKLFGICSCKEKLVKVKKKREIRLFHVFIGVLLVLSLHILYEGLLEDIIPHSRQLFWSYESFDKQTERVVFRKDLPESAHDMKYYVYEGMLRDKCGYHVKFSAADYEVARQERFEFYSDREEIGGGYRYKGGPKKYVSLEQMEEKRIDFLGKIIPEEEIEQYYFLCFDLYEGSEIYNFDGVLCNDETCEMVEFGYYGPY